MKTYPDLKALDNAGRGLDDLRIYGDMVYIEKEKIQISVRENALIVRDITDAMKQGKTVKEVMLIFMDFRDYQEPPLQNYLLSLNLSDSAIIETLLYHTDQLPTPEHEDLIIKEKEHKAKDIFSPYYKPKKVNPLTKWTVNKVVKAILAEQVTKAQTDMILTDDYAHDNAVNFHQKTAIPLYSFAKELTESPSGWSVYVDEKTDTYIKLSVNCHHFDYKTFYIAV